MGVQEDIELLERNIDKLKNEYEQFFMGTIKIPPLTIQTAVERIIRKYLGGGINNSSLRFRYQNTVARYTTLSELWKRRMRMKEEGIVIGSRPQTTGFDMAPKPPPAATGAAQEKKPAPKKGPKPPAPSSKPFSATTRDPHQEKQIVDSIYQEFVRAQQKTGAGAKQVSQDSFRNLIAKQVETIKKTHKCSGVNFRVDIQDGEVKLKAKPVK
ncbi:hypothetical protein JXQ70_06235 [bacterium]|nr:hypothetical protein [bacterium]